MIDCRQCKHAERGYHGNTFCLRSNPRRSIDWMRDDRNECKRAALMFEDKDAPKEKKQPERWIPY